MERADIENRLDLMNLCIAKDVQILIIEEDYMD